MSCNASVYTSHRCTHVQCSDHHRFEVYMLRYTLLSWFTWHVYSTLTVACRFNNVDCCFLSRPLKVLPNMSIAVDGTRLVKQLAAAFTAAIKSGRGKGKDAAGLFNLPLLPRIPERLQPMLLSPERRTPTRSPVQMNQAPTRGQPLTRVGQKPAQPPAPAPAPAGESALQVRCACGGMYEIR